MPFYAYPGMDLVFSGTGLQPLLFVLGFTTAIAYVTTGFRDKPWLLVLGSLTVAAVAFVGIIWLLQFFEQSNAFNVLFSGAGYFTTTKIFGTVAEANAPDRGMLFASFGPIVFILALSMGIIALWRGTRQRRHEHVFMATWILWPSSCRGPLRVSSSTPHRPWPCSALGVRWVCGAGLAPRK